MVSSLVCAALQHCTAAVTDRPSFGPWLTVVHAIGRVSSQSAVDKRFSTSFVFLPPISFLKAVTAVESLSKVLAVKFRRKPIIFLPINYKRIVVVLCWSSHVQKAVDFHISIVSSCFRRFCIIYTICSSVCRFLREGQAKLAFLRLHRRRGAFLPWDR